MEFSSVKFDPISPRRGLIEVGSSSRGGQLRHVKIVDAGGVPAGDLGLFVLRHALQDLARLRKGRLAMRIVRALHHVVDADDVMQANADGLLLEARSDVAVEEVAREHAVLELVDRLAVALAVGVVHRGKKVGRPRPIELDDGQCESDEKMTGGIGSLFSPDRGHTYGNRLITIKLSAASYPRPAAIKVGSGSSRAEPRFHANGRNRCEFPAPPASIEGPQAALMRRSVQGRFRRPIAALPGRAASSRRSEFDLLWDAERIVDLDAQVSDGAFELRMTKQQLHCSQIAGLLVDLCHLRSPH
jgi:hypothetical protein